MRNDKETTRSDQAIPLTESEKLMMAVLTDLGEDASGPAIRQEIEQRRGRSVSLGAIYLILDRLEAKGYVSSLWKPDTSASEGRAKRHFTIHTTED